MKHTRTFLPGFLILAASVFGCSRPMDTGAGASPSGSPPVKRGTETTAARLEDAPPTGIVTAEPGPDQPVVIGAAIRPAKVRPGETLTLFVQVCIAPTWHIYGNDSAGEAFPTTLQLKGTEGVEPVGPWTYPAARAAADSATLRYEGTVTFRQQLRVAAGAVPGPLEVTCEFGYQACDPFHCQPPTNLVLKASAEVVAKD